VFLWLPSPQAALARVARRVREGGHAIPDNVVIRRYHAGLRNLRQLYLLAVDGAFIFDNADEGRVAIAELVRGSPVRVRDAERWALIEEAAR
jgi:predicted ABC-type ATPase